MDDPGAIRLESVVACNNDLVASELDGEVVMMSIEKGRYYGLDEVGSRIWALLAEPRRVSDLCDLLLEEFEVSRDECETDVLAFLNAMAGDGLVQVVTA